MNEFLSTRQVIDILKVDRITIYRMLQDGRLKGIKIGQQWRFSRDEVERLLNGEAAADRSIGKSTSNGFPTHCVQTIQELFSGISGISAIMVDMEGNPLTQLTRPCDFCLLMLSSSEGKQACGASRQDSVKRATQNGQVYTCHAGLQYIAMPVEDGETLAGYFLTGQFKEISLEAQAEGNQIHDLSVKYSIPEDQLRTAAQHIPLITKEQQPQVKNWSKMAVSAIKSILKERTGFLSRLQQIANLSQVG